MHRCIRPLVVDGLIWPFAGPGRLISDKAGSLQRRWTTPIDRSINETVEFALRFFFGTDDLHAGHPGHRFGQHGGHMPVGRVVELVSDDD